MMFVQMMKKAEEATTQAQQLLQKSLQNWLPGWLEVQYDKVMTSMLHLHPLLCILFIPHILLLSLQALGESLAPCSVN